MGQKLTRTRVNKIRSFNPIKITNKVQEYIQKSGSEWNYIHCEPKNQELLEDFQNRLFNYILNNPDLPIYIFFNHDDGDIQLFPESEARVIKEQWETGEMFEGHFHELYKNKLYININK